MTTECQDAGCARHLTQSQSTGMHVLFHLPSEALKVGRLQLLGAWCRRGGGGVGGQETAVG